MQNIAGQNEIELLETTEVPVVERVSLVVEEIHLRKVATERTHVVSDTIRHTEALVRSTDKGNEDSF